MSDFNPNLSTRTVLMEKYKEKLESRFRFPKFEFFEPIVQNRFCVYFPDIFEMESFLIQKITAPKLRLINNNYQWNDITISFVDNVGRSISDKLLKIIEFCKIQKGIHQIDKILFSFRINNLDPTGKVIQSVIVDVENVISIDLGKNDYASTDFKICKLILKPLNCRIE